jgi:hypothetical protein
MRKSCMLLLIISLSICATYTVDKASILVGFADGVSAEYNAASLSVTDLGFGTVLCTSGSASEFVSNNCAVIMDYAGANAVSGWDSEITTNGRGYLQLNNLGWMMFDAANTASISAKGFFLALINDKTTELTTFPNLLDNGWSGAGGLGYYADKTNNYIAYYEDETFPNIATARKTVGMSPVDYPRSLTYKDSGKGRGVFCGWNIYGDKALAMDIKLLENAIIFTAQPPKANAGGPYRGSVGKAVTLDGSASTDNVSIALYEWDLNGDGVFDLSVASPTATYAYEKNYSGKISLRCTDNLGCRSISDTTISVVNTDVEEQSAGYIKALYR